MARPLLAYVVFCSAILLLWLPGRDRRPAPLPEAGHPTVEDGCGARVALGPDGRDIVLLTPTIAEYLFVNGTADRLLSGYAANGQVVQGTVLADRFPALRGPRIVNSLVPQASSAEWLLALAPTAVFAWSFQVATLRSVGLPALCLLQGTSSDVLQRNAQTVAPVAAPPGRVQALTQSYGQTQAEVRKTTQGAPRVPVLFLSVNADGRLTVMGRSQAEQESLDAAGIEDISPRSSGTSVLDAEQLILIDPPMIVLSSSGVDWEGPDAAAFMQDRRWQTLQAVRTHKVFAKPRGMSLYFSGMVESPLYSRWLAELAHPARVPPTLRTVMNEQYRRAFGSDSSSSELDVMLRTVQNRASCGYARFMDSPLSTSEPECMQGSRP